MNANRDRLFPLLHNIKASLLTLVCLRNMPAAAYHVVKGRYYAADLKRGLKLESVYQNQELEVYRTSYNVRPVRTIDFVLLMLPYRIFFGRA